MRKRRVQFIAGPSREPVPAEPYRMEKKKKSADIYFYDVIGSSWEGTTAKQFAKDLKEIGSDIETLNIFMNSPGGAVFDGVAIYNQLVRHSAKKIVQIDGYAASIASVIAMAGDEIRIASNGMIMIHNPWAWVDIFMQGESEDFRKAADQLVKAADKLDKIRESILDTYVRRTGTDEDKISQMMADETWLTAEESVEMGFADKLTEAVELAALAKHDLKAFRNIPKSLAEIMASSNREGGQPPSGNAGEAPAPHPAFVKASAHLTRLGLRPQGQP